MAKVIDQEIPPEYHWQFSSVIRVREYPPDETGVGLRYPWRIRNSQGCRTIRPPILRGPDVSAWQCAHRLIFGKCVQCFNKQPEDGGVEPPTLGYRNRSWWYTDAGGSGLWYYTYFIKQTIIKYLTGVTPLWCMKPADWSAYTTTQSLGHEACNHSDLRVVDHDGNKYYGWVQRNDVESGTLNVYFADLHKHIDVDYPILVNAYKCENLLSCVNLSWSTQPPLGPLLSTLRLEDSEYGWRSISVGDAQLIALVCMSDAQILFRGITHDSGNKGPSF